MSETLIIKKYNETYLHVDCEDVGVLYELNDVMTFDVPGAKFTPKFKAKLWDGKIKLYQIGRKLIYAGLLDEIKDFCKTRGYEYKFVDSKLHGMPDQQSDITPEECKKFIDDLNIHSKTKKLEVRDYQYAAVYSALKNNRRTVLSPTGSGKSLIQYCITRYFTDQDMRVLIIVPTISLVHQMVGDFKDYSSEMEWSADDNVHMIMSGQEKLTDKNIVVSTWQSIFRMPNTFFNSFDCIMADECHLAKASSITSIMEKASDVKYRYGLTGSLDNSKTNKLVIQGLFGAVTKVTSTKQLIDEGHLAEINLKCLLLTYNDASKSLVKNMDYQKEIEFIISHEKRNKFIRNLALSLKGNTLILFTRVEKHGEVLHKLLGDKIGDRKLFFVHGKVEAEDREQVRHITEDSDDAIILASVGVFSTGVNIKRLHNLIFASPTKSVIRVLQSLGRGLRKAHDKTQVNVFDIADSIVKLKSKQNFTYTHFKERLAIYSKEDFDYNIIEVPIEK
jgi:superfamily II DNA or RNA helicase